MRDIRFRRYSVRNKQYVPKGHDLYTLANQEPIELLNDDVIEEYTGLVDNANTPIYEGDIVEYIYPRTSDSFRSVVQYGSFANYPAFDIAHLMTDGLTAMF